MHCGCGYAVVVASDVLLLLRKIFYQAAPNRESQDLLSQSQKYMCENADYWSTDEAREWQKYIFIVLVLSLKVFLTVLLRSLQRCYDVHWVKYPV